MTATLHLVTRMLGPGLLGASPDRTLEAGVRRINLDGTDAGPAFDDAKKTDPIGGTTG